MEGLTDTQVIEKCTLCGKKFTMGMFSIEEFCGRCRYKLELRKQRVALGMTKFDDLEIPKEHEYFGEHSD